MENNIISFKLKSSHNEYILTMKLLNDKKPQKLEISLKHILKDEEIYFSIQKSKGELIQENSYLSKFNSIQEIIDYFIKIIKSQNIHIIKPNTGNISYYYIEFFDQEKQLNIQILIPKVEVENIFHISGISGSTDIFEDEKILLKENNNNFSFKKDPNNFKNEITISDDKDECENFTAFINKNKENLIVWTIKEEGIINIYDFKNKIKTKQKAHTNNINSVHYFHDYNKSIDYIISSSKFDDNIIKIWKIDYENKNNLLLIKSFSKQFFKRDIEIFCIFNYNEYDTENSYIFIYETPLLMEELLGHHINEYKNKEIICYKLNTELDNIIWGKDEDNNVINYKSINNFYKINYLDTYYDIDEKQLYLINCNENNTEVIFNLFDNYIA